MLKPPMKMSEAGLALTRSCEGCVLHAYLDSVGVPTIGYGHTYGVVMGMTCTQAEADEWLAVDMVWAESTVNHSVDVPLTQNRFDALTDFCFNEGVGAFQGSTLLRILNSGAYALAAAQLPRWDMAGGKVLPGLVRRRELERQLFLR